MLGNGFGILNVVGAVAASAASPQLLRQLTLGFDLSVSLGWGGLEYGGFRKQGTPI